MHKIMADTGGSGVHNNYATITIYKQLVWICVKLYMIVRTYLRILQVKIYKDYKLIKQK